MIRFHLDEHVDPAVAAGLRQRGVDVTTTAEVGLQGAADETQLSFALQEGRVLFTNDSDFLKLHSSGIRHAGIAYCHPGSRSIGDIIRWLALMDDCLEPEEMAGKIEFL